MRKVLFILGQLSDTDVDWLARHGRREVQPQGRLLIRAGLPLEHLYIVLEGQLSVLAGDGRTMARVGAGDILGEVAFVEVGKATATVRIDEQARVLALPVALLRRKLDDDLPFAARFYRALALCLADHLSNTMRHAGLAEDGAGDGVDELGAAVLDNLHLAGARFDRILKQLAG